MRTEKGGKGKAYLDLDLIINRLNGRHANGVTVFEEDCSTLNEILKILKEFYYNIIRSQIWVLSKLSDNNHNRVHKSRFRIESEFSMPYESDFFFTNSSYHSCVSFREN